ncbi:2-C-methyl-D-erythritol 4-phosphate cytidylyltransferase [Hydrogenophaga sp.]|uniref:2-C-methyl-D-erythritol 4-phosphate cytidylyltransferase n=1 Tax=Hydrogenophaga sp. TaxID=1904254 RepID=UPI00272F2989|nr:2-C-methyl-D-erythritol 4-phosphate cytidylyltransferase [Hydrogenophaga sp.]MDP2017788.1 2-C-methyl-D-erythritol 4-phosphate cytidylyltransferase [Hydrogenophaga sp.]MDP3165669.1 2-C-methyl-D-erythritol 4-phosphate cytidylyltransferase [Hydrogenophaga sp.]MDP3810810.1 2-C-methyl-D-erythritol 4-phosphate cytidylyltransferase [Hydrogenophaga sp.]
MPDVARELTPHTHPEAGIRCHALLPCAGTGSRAGTEVPKQYQPILGLPMVLHTLVALRAVVRLDRLVVVAAPDDDFWATGYPGVTALRCGGGTRAESVFNGLQTLLDQGTDPADWVLVHDAARCLVTAPMVNALIDACQHDPVGGLLAIPLPDTLKAEADGRVTNTVDRAGKWLAQTPQMFRLGALHAALKATAAQGFAGVTDEASAMEMAGHRPLLVQGSARNFKITYPDDFALAEAIFRSRA